MSFALGAIAVLIPFALAYLLVETLDPMARAEKEFWISYRARTPLPDEAFCALEFPDFNSDLEIPSQVRLTFSEQLQLERELLRADDDFLFYFAEYDAEELVRSIEDRFDIALSDEEITSVPCTIRGATQLVATKLATKRKSTSAAP